MSLRRPAKKQPQSFEFNPSSLEAANSVVSKYPKGKQQSAVMALLYIAQKQNDPSVALFFCCFYVMLRICASELHFPNFDFRTFVSGLLTLVNFRFRSSAFELQVHNFSFRICVYLCICCFKISSCIVSYRLFVVSN